MEQIAIYLRLSKEDEFVKDESNSITNQRAFIRGFINKNKKLRKMSVVEFVDDGYSGKNMDRPDAYCEAKRPDLRSKTVAFRF